jgi:cell division FtsZ-interacting protein ZapD
MTRITYGGQELGEQNKLLIKRAIMPEQNCTFNDPNYLRWKKNMENKRHTVYILNIY